VQCLMYSSNMYMLDSVGSGMLSDSAHCCILWRNCQKLQEQHQPFMPF